MHNMLKNGFQNFVLYVSERIPPDFGKEDTENFASFLWSALQKCPEDRIPATGLLSHPFILGCREEEGGR